MPFSIPDEAMPRNILGTSSSMMMMKLSTAGPKSLETCSFHAWASLPAVRLKEKMTTAARPLIADGSSSFRRSRRSG